MQNQENNFQARLHAAMLKFDLGILMLCLFPCLLLTEKFISTQKRGNLWRRTAVWIVRTVLRMNEVHLQIKYPKNTRFAAIYAANHPSHFDGFLLLSILGPNAILFTAPFGQFPNILGRWLKKMEAVDVRRDPVDDKRYPEAHSKKQAITKAVKHLETGKSLIIFPEGHIEILHTLHYFHTGAGRIALESRTPIVPVSIINAEKIFFDEHRLLPGMILISLGEPIMPPKVSAAIAEPKPTVLRLRHKIENSIAENLPARYLPNYYKQRTKRVGVFIDIDRTIYEGLSQKDLIAYLLFLHKIRANDAFKIFYWLFLEKLRQIKHENLMRQALLVLRGWDVAELRREIHRAFEKKLLEKIQYGVFPLMKDHAEAEHSLILISEVIHPLAKEFKNFFHAQKTLDTKLQTVHHCYTGETNCLCYKNEKARLVADFAKRAGIDLAKSYAFADSAADLPFLKLVKYPTAVNPDHDLLNYAVDHDWEVILNAS